MARGTSVSAGQFVVSVIRITAIFLGVAAGILIFPNLTSAQREGQFATEGILVTGTVLRIDDRTSRGSSRGSSSEVTVRIITYRYEAGNQAYQVEAIATSETARNLRAGDPIRVRYLPNDPQSHTFLENETESRAWQQVQTGIVLAGLGSVLLMVSFLLPRRAKAPQT